MELIPYKEFAKLRMKQFVPDRMQTDEDDGFEWMGGYWISECPRGCGFTHVSRHEDTPDEAGGLEIDFRDLPPPAMAKMLGAIRLPLRPAMTLQEVEAVLGEPEHTDVFVADRKTYDFTVGSRDRYHISLTIHETDGLIHVAVIRKDVLSKCDG